MGLQDSDEYLRRLLVLEYIGARYPDINKPIRRLIIRAVIRVSYTLEKSCGPQLSK
jgi:hypothetical protein